MSIKILVGLRDSVAECFTSFHTETNAATAIRAFTQGVKDSSNKDDYSVWQLAIIDEQNGTVTPNEPLRIYSGMDIKTDNVVAINDN